jgi:4-amino-4-deoxy-L-arabinose transferase-like glycosyltransferase
VIALAALLRFPLLDIFPGSTPDEGGWPLAVRSWVDDGDRTYDLHSAPGYHVLLGIPFAIAGSSYEVARTASVTAAVIALAFWFFAVAKAVGRPAAVISALLIATSFDAITNDRRALIEPYQMLAMSALFWAWCTREHRRGVWIALLTAALLLTKAIAIVFVAAFGASTFLESARELGKRRADRLALAAGVGLAVAVYIGLYLSDPPTFLRGWGDNVGLATYEASDAVFRVGRFGFAPETVKTSLLALSHADPVVYAVALLGFVAALKRRVLLPLAFGIPFTLGFLLLQVWQAGNYFHPITPMACILAGWWLSTQRKQWQVAVLCAAVSLSGVRFARGVAAADPAERIATADFEARLQPTDHVLSAAYLSMRLSGTVTSYPEFPLPYLPSLDTLRARKITWLLYDKREWANAHRRLPPDSVRAWLDSCCVVEPGIGGGVFLAYRVR